MRSELPRAELEVRLVYSLIVAGKSARFANAVVARLFLDEEALGNPFGYLRALALGGADLLRETLQRARTGKYRTLESAIRWLVEADLDLAEVTPEQLEACPGIGPKTSRFFVLWTRPGERYAALDVHVLRWLREQGFDAPTSTPSGAKYRELERAFISIADEIGIHPRELDFNIWSRAATARNKTPERTHD